MGDFLIPRKNAIERLRQKFDLYRRHHNGTVPRHETAYSGLVDQQRQETAILHRRWLEARAKKTGKNKHESKSRCASNSESGPSDQAKGTKRKFDDQSSPIGDNEPVFDEGPDAKKDCNGTDQSGVSSISVNINLQQFSSQPNQTIHTNVTVKTRCSSESGSVSSTKQDSTKTVPCYKSSSQVNLDPGVQCKQEPRSDDDSSAHNIDVNNSDEFTNLGFDIHPDMLQDILSSLGPDLMDQLSHLGDDENKTGNATEDVELHQDAKKFLSPMSHNVPVSSLPCSRSQAQFSTAQQVRSDAHVPFATAPQVVPSNHKFLHQRHPQMASPSPAALTLKQMAEQHQRQSNGNDTPGHAFGVFGAAPKLQPTSEPSGACGVFGTSGLSLIQTKQENVQNTQNIYPSDSDHLGARNGELLQLAGTKPLRHFSNDSGMNVRKVVSNDPGFHRTHSMDMSQMQHLQISQGTIHVMQQQQTNVPARMIYNPNTHPQTITISQSQSVALQHSRQRMIAPGNLAPRQQNPIQQKFSQNLQQQLAHRPPPPEYKPQSATLDNLQQGQPPLTNTSQAHLQIMQCMPQNGNYILRAAPSQRTSSGNNATPGLISQQSGFPVSRVPLAQMTFQPHSGIQNIRFPSAYNTIAVQEQQRFIAAQTGQMRGQWPTSEGTVHGIPITQSHNVKQNLATLRPNLQQRPQQQIAQQRMSSVDVAHVAQRQVILQQQQHVTTPLSAQGTALEFPLQQVQQQQQPHINLHQSHSQHHHQQQLQQQQHQAMSQQLQQHSQLQAAHHAHLTPQSHSSQQSQQHAPQHSHLRQAHTAQMPETREQQNLNSEYITLDFLDSSGGIDLLNFDGTGSGFNILDDMDLLPK